MKTYSRTEQLQQAQQDFDVVIIGGGSTGAAVAREMVARGLSAVLIERGDFASGTSSRSTKLLHGGVRYLEKAFKSFSWAQFSLVMEALSERASVMSIAPHLCRRLPILLPLYRWWHLPYYFVGLVLYDLLSGRRSIGRSRVVFANETCTKIPMLSREGLKGSVLYYDGQFDDARINVEVILAALSQGLVALSYAEVMEIKHGLESRGSGFASVRVLDRLSGREFQVRGRTVVNACGPFVESVWHDEKAPKVRGSSGVHIVVDGQFTPEGVGVLIPKTSDNRVLFMLPWKGKTLIGTTDNPQEPVEHPSVSRSDIDFITTQINSILSCKITSQDVLSAWVGIRPLLASESSDTQSIVREHAINISGKVLTVTGGKWTTFLSIARDVVKALEESRLISQSAQINYSSLPGVEGLEKLSAPDLVRDYGISDFWAVELLGTFGGRAPIVLEFFPEMKTKYVDPDVALFATCSCYCARYEAALTVEDLLARRLRTAYLDLELANAMAPVVTSAMAEVLGWSDDEQQKKLSDWGGCYDRLAAPLH